MNILLIIWRWIGQQGVKKEYPIELVKNIEFVNHATFLTFSITFPTIFVIYSYFHDLYQVFFNAFLAANYLLVFLFNRMGFHHLAKILLFTVAIVNTFLAASSFGYESGTHFTYIIIVFATILTFDRAETKSLIFLLFAIIASLLLLVFTDFSLLLIDNLSPLQQRATSWIMVYFGLVGSVVVAYFYIQKFTKQRELVEKSNALLQTKFDELQKLNTELDRFVYSVSHDLRAPIASVLGLVYLGKRTQDVAEIQQYLDLQEKSLKKLDSFIADILSYSRNKRTEVQAQAVDFEQELADILAIHVQYEASLQIQTAIHVKQENTFFTDKQRLTIALNNLISNAFRYYNPYKQNPFINIVVEVSQKEAVLKIIDNGIGISKEHLPRIFEMFYRATNRTVGSGLGLYIVKEVIEKLNGTIGVVSEIGKGTTFTIEIPNLQEIKQA